MLKLYQSLYSDLTTAVTRKSFYCPTGWKQDVVCFVVYYLAYQTTSLVIRDVSTIKMQLYNKIHNKAPFCICSSLACVIYS